MAKVDESGVAFLDLETTGLDPQRHEIWEIGLIVDEVEYEWQLRVSLYKADSGAMRINRYYERPATLLSDGEIVALEVARLTSGRMLVGAVPSFDAAFLDPWMRSYRQCPAWSHRLICVETLAAGVLKTLPCGLGKMAEMLEVKVDPGERHTAIGDTRMAREIYLKIMGSE